MKVLGLFEGSSEQQCQAEATCPVLMKTNLLLPGNILKLLLMLIFKGYSSVLDFLIKSCSWTHFPFHWYACLNYTRVMYHFLSINWSIVNTCDFVCLSLIMIQTAKLNLGLADTLQQPGQHGCAGLRSEINWSSDISKSSSWGGSWNPLGEGASYRWVSVHFLCTVRLYMLNSLPAEFQKLLRFREQRLRSGNWHHLLVIINLTW